MEIKLEKGANAVFYDIHDNDVVNIGKIEGKKKSEANAADNVENDETEAEEDADPLPTGWSRWPEQVFANYTENTIYKACIVEAGKLCHTGSNFACLMKVCQDHGCLYDGSNKLGFAKALLALRLTKRDTDMDESWEDAAKRIANGIKNPFNKMRQPYRELSEKDMKSLKDKCMELGSIFEKQRLLKKSTR